MKFGILSTIAVSAMFLVSCGGSSESEQVEDTTTVTEEAVATAVNYTADAAASQVNWRGEVAGVYGHEGYVNLQSGTLSFEGDKLTGGEFIVDMSVIFPIDSASFKDKDGGRITDLQGHLSTEDFFNTATFPTSKFVITGVEGNTVTGNLTIRDKTNEETIELESTDMADGTVTVKGKLVFDRQKYDVAWEHYMKDMILSDDITINYTLIASK